MLRDAVAAEHYLMGDVPLGDIGELLDAWPERRVDIVTTVCTGARLGSDRARSIVDGLVDETLRQDLKPAEVRSIYESFLLIDDGCAARIVKRLADEFEGLDDEGKRDGYGLRPLVELAYLAAARYLDRAAVGLMLDLAVFDTRATNPNPEHPLRKLADLCTRVHPDIPPTADHRVLVASALADFLSGEPSESQWRIWAAVAQSVLTPHARGTYTAPEDIYRFNMIETIVAPDHARTIHERLWPPIRARLGAAPTYVIAEFVSLVHEWLRVGGGYDHPFGQDHPDEAIDAAAAIGRAMLQDLIDLAPGRPALIARLAHTCSMFGIELPAPLFAEVAQNPFFRDVDRADDWQAAVEALRADIAGFVANWSAEPPDEVVRRLVELRAELKNAGNLWPDRVWMACRSLAEHAAGPNEWVEASLRQDLFPEAAPFLEEAIAKQASGLHTLVEQCLQDPSARGVTLAALLSNATSDELLTEAIARLRPDDYGLLDTLMIRGELSAETQLAILEGAPDGARGAFAVALAGRTDKPEESVTEELREAFLAAVVDIRPAELDRNVDYQLNRLMRFLAARYPDTLEEMVRRRIEEAAGGSLYEALGHEGWQTLHLLPRANRTRLLLAFPATRWFLFEHLVGPDADWLEELIDSGVVTPEEATGARNFHGRIAIERMAQLLVPRGIEPARIAGLAFSGSWTGEESARYDTLAKEFSAYAESGDSSVAAVGAAGAEMFTRARDEALQRERQRRIRGA